MSLDTLYKTLDGSEESIESGSRDQSWSELIKRVAGGDQSALTDLYNTTSSLIFGFVLRFLGDGFAAEEILIDVYKQVWHQASRFDSNRGSPLAWLITIARCRAIDRLRFIKRQQELRQNFAKEPGQGRRTINPEQALFILEQQKLVRSALNQLPPEQREVIELAYYSGLSHSEIAAQLALPLGTVKTRIRLAMIKLRDSLSTLRGEPRLLS